MTKLIVVESPGKIKTIKKYAGKGYEVKASIGHIKDLPKKELGIDTKKDFEPSFVVNDDKKDVVKDLKRAAEKADAVLIATDPDREGECIAQHLSEELKVSGKCRITFNEITQDAIRKAIQSPREINTEKVNAQLARRVLDRLVGYKISPLLWRKVGPGTSAGRVQSAALLLLSDRERQIRRFTSKDYWTIDVEIDVGGTVIQAEVVDDQGKQKQVDSEEAAQQIAEEIKKAGLKLSKFEKKVVSKSPYPPFITSTLQQFCAAAHKMAASQTMQTAQKLYEGVSVAGQGEVALITYMRTDSVRSAPEAIAMAREYISDNFDKDYSCDKARSYAGKGKNQQDAHEAIRPTDLSIRSNCIADRNQQKVYDSIWRRFVASQMADAKIEQIKAQFKASGHTLEARGTKIVFDGFMAVYQTSMEEQNLPTISDKSKLVIKESNGTKHTTQPPKRYSEAQLIKSLEKEGIGRPSTYASILKNIVDRNYVKKDNGSFHLTDVGLLVNDMLQENFPEIINLKFTSDMEDQLDDIESGKNWKDTIRGFYDILSNAMKNARKTKSSIGTDKNCAKCTGPMILKHGSTGYFLGCSGYPACKSTMPVPDTFSLMDFIDSYKEKSIEINITPSPDAPACPQCESPLLLRRSKFGEFWGCSKYPECKYVKHKHKEIIPCPDCDDGKIIERKSKKQTFYGCSNYPDCKKTYSNKPTETLCTKCEDHMVQHKKKLVCNNKSCEDFVHTGPRRFKKKTTEES